MTAPANEVNIEELESKLNYNFKDNKLLKTALSHPSIGNCDNYERLEFLGDAVLELTISEWLFKAYPHYPEGTLTKLRSNIVCSKSLVEVAKKLDLGDYLYLGKGEELTGGRMKPSILENVTEAVIGAVYFDGGFDAAKYVIHRLFDEIVSEKINQPITDYKTRFQETIHKTLKKPILYKVIDKEGPPHKTTFFVELSVGNKAICQGSGTSKKAAEQKAAQKALETFDNWYN